MNGYSPHKHIPLGSYGIVTGVFAAASAAYVEAHRRSGRSLPEKLPLGDFMILAAATQKLSRLIAKERVTSFLRSPFTRYAGEAGPSEVSEEPRGTGLRRSVGELLICPYCGSARVLRPEKLAARRHTGVSTAWGRIVTTWIAGSSARPAG